MKQLQPVHNRLYRFAQALTRNADDAADLAADTVLAAFQRFDHIDDHQAFLSYLFTIATRLHNRRRGRRAWFGAYNQTEAENIPDSSGLPDSGADVQALYMAIDKLTPDQREAITMFELAGLSLQEISALHGWSDSKVKVTLHRARKQLARLLGVDHEPGQEVQKNGHTRTNGQISVTNTPAPQRIQ